MSLPAGTRLGPYEIVSALGAGGMGEVYRAHDTKLGRDVALKILPQAFVSDPERVARFQREARTLASLNHPNIGGIYGLEETNGVTALVMELVEGEDLSQRVARGPIPIEEALPIARQIAEGLEAAHEQGIIHRDLKPANIKVRPDGTVKVLDFGLAKVHARDRTSFPVAEIADSPTSNSPAATQAGIVLGTVAYMSPEQARGSTVDKRADVWAFGVVLWEMLTGSRPFKGATVSDTLASVLTSEPDWNALAPTTPAAIRRLLRRCLQKDRRRRLADAADARLEIEEVLTFPDADPLGSISGSSAPTARLVRIIAAALALIAVTGVSTALYLRSSRVTQTAAPVHQFGIAPPPSASFVGPGGDGGDLPVLAISPDGRWVAFPATIEGKAPLLWLRALDSLEARPLPGTENANLPFWSPDSRFVAFFTGSELRKVAVAGGSVQTVCALPLTPSSTGPPNRGGTWSVTGTILFARAGQPDLFTVPDGGGTVARLKVAIVEDEVVQWPAFLPDGNLFLYEARSRQDQPRGLFVRGLDSPAGARLLDTDARAQFVSPDRILFVRGQTLMTRRFDPATLRVTGSEVPVASELGVSVAGFAAFSASNTGVLVWARFDRPMKQPTWVDTSGMLLETLGDPGDYEQLSLARVATRFAFSRFDPNTRRSAVWVRDIDGQRESRVYSPTATSALSPDGRMVAFNLLGGPSTGLNVFPASGEGSVENLVAGESIFPTDWSPDSRYVLFTKGPPPSYGSDVWAYDFTEREASPVVQTRGSDVQGRFSPDAQWITYVSFESGGREEVYVRPFGRAGERVQISAGGGTQPQWRPDGRQLFYLSPDRYLTAVDIRHDGNNLVPGRPVRLFELRIRTFASASINSYRKDYAVSHDGSRFLVNQLANDGSGPQLNVMVNWTSATVQR